VFRSIFVITTIPVEATDIKSYNRFLVKYIGIKWFSLEAVVKSLRYINTSMSLNKGFLRLLNFKLEMVDYS